MVDIEMEIITFDEENETTSMGQIMGGMAYLAAGSNVELSDINRVIPLKIIPWYKYISVIHLSMTTR
jgi:hypothetical protein